MLLPALLIVSDIPLQEKLQEEAQMVLLHGAPMVAIHGMNVSPAITMIFLALNG